MARLSVIIAAAILLGGCAPDQNSDRQPSATDGFLAPVSNVAPAIATGWSPSEACAYLSPSLVTRGYRHEYDDAYYCSSAYKEIGISSAGLANNLAYYVTGTLNVAATVKLVLNYNQPSNTAAATAHLVAESKALSIKATEETIPPSVLAAIESGRPLIEIVGDYRHEVRRDEWPTGRGYEIHYILSALGKRY